MRLKQLREEHGLSRKELGDILGVSTVSIFHWEKGVRRPRRAHIEAASAFFGISPNYLATGRNYGIRYEAKQSREALEEYLIEVQEKVAEIARTDPASVLISIDIRHDDAGTSD